MRFWQPVLLGLCALATRGSPSFRAVPEILLELPDTLRGIDSPNVHPREVLGKIRMLAEAVGCLHRHAMPPDNSSSQDQIPGAGTAQCYYLIARSLQVRHIFSVPSLWL